MSYLLTAVFENGFCEIYLPGTDNKTVPTDIKPSVSGRDEDIILPLEVWSGIWAMGKSTQFKTTEREQPVGRVELHPGQLFNCEFPDGMVFSLTVQEVTSGHTQFEKYYLDADKVRTIRIGSKGDCIIQSSNRFVSPAHAEILMENGKTVIRDLGSVNGTFVNGRRLTEPHELQYGDVIYIIGLKIIWLGSVLAVNNPDNECTVHQLRAINIHPTSEEPDGEDSGTAAEEMYFLRTPRRLEELDTESFSIERCPAKQMQKRPPLIFTIGPSFTMVIPIALGAMLSMGESGFGMAGLVMSGGAAIIGSVWAVMNVRYQKKTELETEARRVELYQTYIAKMKETIRNRMLYNRTVLENRYPDAAHEAEFALTGSHRLWEKSSSHQDFLDVRLGLGCIPSPNEIIIQKDQAVIEHDPLNQLAEEVKNAMSALPNIPVALSLVRYPMVGIVSAERANAAAIARNIIVQLTAAHPYTDVRMCGVFPPKEEDLWHFMRFLPHTWTPDGKLRMLCDDLSSVGDVMYVLSGVIRERIERQKEGHDEEMQVLPHYVIVLADWNLVKNEPIAKYLLNPDKTMGMTVLLLAETTDRLPNTCTAIIRDDADYQGFYHTANSFPEQRSVRFDTLSPEQADQFARSLSNYHVRERGVSTEIPELLSFLDMYKTSNVESLDMYHNWLQNRTYESMRSLIGSKAGNQPLYLDIHEKYHGPHGLVAGTTGSGKSETLQTYILSLVVNYHPHEVSFIIIDYKGGGMAQSFIGLPHLSGVITNLGGHATNRALMSIHAEIRHRQSVFNEYKVKHIDDYIELYRSKAATEPMPHLLIIADEFAELKKEQPEFVRALVSAARVGRSLGIHLILATQKPSGVVDDEIWSNTRFRLCLRVADKQDSNEMLKRPDAAKITGTGRGFFQVGSDEIFEEFQSGWSGAPYEPDVPYSDDKNIKVELLNLIGKNGVPKQKKKKKTEGTRKITQLDAVVQYAAKIAKENKIPALRQIWLPPLPKRLYADELPQESRQKQFSLHLPIGLADRPETQSQYPVAVDFLADGNLLVCGSAGSGKTTLLQMMLYSAVTLCTPDEIHLYLADFSSRTMAAFSALPHVGAVCFEGDDEKLEAVFLQLHKTLEERKTLFAEKGIGAFREYVTQYQDCPAVLMVIDNYTAFSESCGQYEEDLILLSREGASYGIYFAVSCNGSGDMRSRLRQNFTSGIGLQLPDRYEYEAAVGERSDLLPEDRIAGRGIIKAPCPVEFQTALPVREEPGLSEIQTLRRQFDAMAKQQTKSRVKKIGEKPGVLSLKAVLQSQAFQKLPENRYIIGIHADTRQLVTADFDKEFCYTVSGSVHSGKTNFLKAIAMQGKAKGCQMYLYEEAGGDLRPFAESVGFARVVQDDASLFDLMEKIIVPEFSKRNLTVNHARDEKTDIVSALKNETRILFLINNMTSFIQAIYSTHFDMSGFFELAMEKGASHKIQFLAAVTPDDWTDCARYQVMRRFASYGRGIHLGGLFDQQSILHFELSAADSVRQLPAGTGYAVSENGTVLRLMTPLAEEEKHE